MMMGCDQTQGNTPFSRLPQYIFHRDNTFSSPINEFDNDSLPFYPFGEERKTKWWPVRKAAYGTVLSENGREEIHQPFILPAMNPNRGIVDNEMQTAIQHFNIVLCRFYSQMILPLIYNCTGHMYRPGVRAGPIYVNPKQYHCILRRRIQREKLMKANRGLFVRKKYLHESRHRHATKRLRNAHGRFVSKNVKAETEIEAEADQTTTGTMTAATSSSDQAKSDDSST